MKKNKKLSNGAILAACAFAGFIIYNIAWYDQPNDAEFTISLIVFLLLLIIASYMDINEQEERERKREERRQEVIDEMNARLNNNNTKK